MRIVVLSDLLQRTSSVNGSSMNHGPNTVSHDHQFPNPSFLKRTLLFRGRSLDTDSSPGKRVALSYSSECKIGVQCIELRMYKNGWIEFKTHRKRRGDGTGEGCSTV